MKAVILFRLLRLPHYIKNLLIFAAIFPSGQLFDFVKLQSACVGFVCFCALSSAVYIINDILDKANDQCHSVKRNRPIASETVSVEKALCIAFFLIVLSTVVSYVFLGSASCLFILFYLLLNLLYSVNLKNLPLIDIAIIVSGFLLRLGYGAFITDIKVSRWLYLTMFALTFYLALGKRRNEIIQHNIHSAETRKVLKAYSVQFCTRNMYMCLTLANTFYALWCADKEIIALRGEYLLFTIPLVLMIFLRYNMVIEKNFDGDPVCVLLKDKVLCVLCVFYGLLMFFFIYGVDLL